MKKLVFIITLLIGVKPHAEVPVWGFFAHHKINKMAVYALPAEMNSFFLQHITYLEEQAVAADKRKHLDEQEACRHYIDIDHYSLDTPFAAMPQQWGAAVSKYSEDTLRAYGILPWQILWEYNSLVEAMKLGDAQRVLFVAADLGHYVADAHVPLHTTVNYDGQLTAQEGIHAFWETRLPELYADSYHFIVPALSYETDVLAAAWGCVAASYAKKDSVLMLEKELQKRFPSDQRFAFEQRGLQAAKKIYSKPYAEAYHLALNGMVERRMKSAVHRIASLWYSAWIDAGQPDMTEWRIEE